MSYPGPYQPVPGGYPYPPAPQPQNGFGTAGFVLGLVGLFFSWIPLVGVIAWPLVLLGVVFAGLGLARANAGGATNKGIAIAGLACSALGLLICLLYAVAFSAAVSSTSAAGGSPAIATPAGAATAATGPSGRSATTARMGQEIRDGSFAFVVTGVEPAVRTLGSGAWSSTAQGEYVQVRVTVTNIGDEAQTFSDSSQKLIDAQGRRFDAATGVAVMYVPDSKAFLNNINPGNSVNGVLVFDVPRGLAPAAVELHDSPFSGGVSVALG